MSAQQQPKIPIRRAVYHRGYDAAMIFSAEFIAEYRARYGAAAVDEIEQRMDDEKNRYNEKMIALIDEMGAASFLPQCCDYDFKYIPDELKEYIEIGIMSSGSEYIKINYDRCCRDILRQLLAGEITMYMAHQKYERCEFIKNNSMFMYGELFEFMN